MTKMMTRFLSVASLLFMSYALVACNSTDGTLGINPDTLAADNNQSAGAAITQNMTASSAIYVAPIIGSTIAAITPLSRQLSASAALNDIRIAAETDPGVTHILKGYFSALSENNQTTIIYVWDVFDPAGTRLHRIQGQINDPTIGTAQDPWANVSNETMVRIADLTLAEFARWRQSLVTTNVQPAPLNTQ